MPLRTGLLVRACGLALSLGAASVSSTGCAALVDGFICGALESESREERQVRQDEARLRKGRPLKHHRSEKHLRYHRQDLLWESLQDDDCDDDEGD